MTSSSEIITPIRLLRTDTPSKRPDPTSLLAGQPAVNADSDDPGLYFADSTLTELLKIGPCHVGDSAPNSAPAVGGFPGNCKGELWLDTTDSINPVLRIWDGADWVIPAYIDPTNFLIPKTLWVSPDGNDLNSGYSPASAKKTIKAALMVAPQGATILVPPGTYLEDNPLAFPHADIQINGAGEQLATITLENDDDLFHMKSGCVVQNFSFSGITTDKAIASFIPSGAGVILSPPVIRNCSNSVEGSTGIFSDGDAATGLKTITGQGFRTSAPGTKGFRTVNKAFIEADNCETAFADISMIAESGGTIRATNCKSLYGEMGLISTGVSDPEQSGDFLGVDSSGVNIQVENLSETLRPYEGQVLIVGDLFYKVSGFSVIDPGNGFSSAPDISVSLGSGPNPAAAQGTAVIESGQLAGITLTYPGNGYTDTDTIVVSITGGSPSSPAQAEVILTPVYYTVTSATEVVSNSTIVSISEPLPYTPSPGDPVIFYRVSKIVAMSHYFGYVGTGDQTPYNGGVTAPGNTVLEQNGGRVFINSMDQSGNFKVGGEFCVNQLDGTVSGFAFSNSVLSTVLPYIAGIN